MKSPYQEILDRGFIIFIQANEPPGQESIIHIAELVPQELCLGQTLLTPGKAEFLRSTLNIMKYPRP